MKKLRTSEQVQRDISAHGHDAILQVFALRCLKKVRSDLGRGLVVALKTCNLGGGRSLTDANESYLDVLGIVRSPIFADVAVASVALEAAEADPELQEISRKLGPLVDELHEAKAREAEAAEAANEERKRRRAELEAAEAAALDAARNAPEVVAARQALAEIPE